MNLTNKLEGISLGSMRGQLETLKKKQKDFFLVLLFLSSSFFLSQAILFDAAVPFFLPMWALVSLRFRKYRVWAFIGAMVGSMYVGFGQAMIHICQLCVFTYSMRYSIARKSIPLTVASSVFVVQLGWQLFMHTGKIPLEVYFFVGFEVTLSLFMTLFLWLAFPSVDRMFLGTWTVERLCATVVVLMMIVTGMKGFMIGQIAVATVLLYLVLLISANIGGIAFAAPAGMMVAMMIGISELSFTGMMAVYGMTGFLAGVMSKYGKLAIAVGASSVSLFFLLYDTTLPLDSTYFVSLGVATGLFFFIPQKKFQQFQHLMKRDDQIELKRQQWMTERLYEQLHDFQQFSQLMSTIIQGSDSRPRQQPIVNTAIPAVCQSCFRYSKCWESDNHKMGSFIGEWKMNYSLMKKASRHRIEEKMKYQCIRFPGLLEELEEVTAKHILNEQLQHGRKMLAFQLRDMSAHLGTVMDTIKEDVSFHQPAEEEIMRQLDHKGVEYYQVDVLREDYGCRKIVCCLPKKKASFETNDLVAKRLIIPILEKYYQEPFEIEKAIEKDDPFDHLYIVFTSAVRFTVDYGVMMVAGNETLQIGDAYEVFSIHDGLLAVLLSDGMGQDANAYYESRKVIRIMRECLHRKMKPETAMHTLHYIMTLNGLDDMYATLDLALIDLQDGRLWAWKAGSMSTYIMRGNQFTKLDSKSVPVGFSTVPSVETTKYPLKAGDLIVMVTDGVFQNNVPIQLQEKALYGILEQYKEASCEQIAERILSELERKFTSSGDDRTVLVLAVDHVLSEWYSFRPARPLSLSSVVKGET